MCTISTKRTTHDHELGKTKTMQHKILRLHIEHLFKVEVEPFLFLLGLGEENGLLALGCDGQCPCRSRWGEGTGAGEGKGGDCDRKLHGESWCCAVRVLLLMVSSPCFMC